MNSRLCLEFCRTSIPKSLLDACHSLCKTDGKNTDKHHRSKTYVDGPESEFYPLFVPHGFLVQIAENKQHQADTKHSVNPEQCSVTMHRGGIKSLHVIESD